MGPVPGPFLCGVGGTGFFSYLSAVLQQPGRVAARHWAGPGRRYRGPALVLGLGVGVATLVLGLLQAHHPAWAVLHQAAPFSPGQLAALGQRTHYWGRYTNLRQLALLPVYALPTWLVYRRQGVRYADAVFVHVLWDTAYNVYSLVLFGLMAASLVRITTLGSGLVLLLMLGYHLAIGHTALDLRWPVAVAKALLTLGLVVGLLRLLGTVGW